LDYIYIGTNLGAVRVFDFEENPAAKMVHKKLMSNTSGVTALAISNDNTWMCVGHQNGKVVLWNIDNLIEPKMLKIADMYKSVITSLDFVSDKNE